MKRCPVCKKVKPPEDFAWKFKLLGVRAATCKLCQKKYRDDWYQDNRKHVIELSAKRRKKNKREVQAWIIDYLSTHPCVDCGESNIVVLEFDHIDPKQKTMTVSQLVGEGYTLPKVKAEVAKCVIRCANCHRKKTAQTRGWYRSR
jgi:hypothetical protein